MKYFLSDIHANLTALQAVASSFELARDDEIYILGDLIDYGMRPNECITFVQEHFSQAIILQGNHEHALLSHDDSRFSSQRGKDASKYTSEILTVEAHNFLKKMTRSKIRIHAGKSVLMVHGSLQDELWGKIDTDVEACEYRDFEIVISGHTHRRHIFEKYIAGGSAETRGKKKILFVNPGAVGQPRNLNTCAQYAVCDDNWDNWQLRSVPYDIQQELSLYHGEIDDFYKKRLQFGI